MDKFKRNKSHPNIRTILGQTDRQTDRHDTTDRPTDRQTDGRTEIVRLVYFDLYIVHRKNIY